jgi:hypothetical protein
VAGHRGDPTAHRQVSPASPAPLGVDAQLYLVPLHLPVGRWTDPPCLAPLPARQRAGPRRLVAQRRGSSIIFPPGAASVQLFAQATRRNGEKLSRSPRVARRSSVELGQLAPVVVHFVAVGSNTRPTRWSRRPPAVDRPDGNDAKRQPAVGFRLIGGLRNGPVASSTR